MTDLGEKQREAKWYSCLFDQSSLPRCFVSPTAVKVLAGSSCPVAPCSNCLSEDVLAEDA